MTLTPRAVLVYRRTELDELVARHGTRQQAAFFLETRGRTIDEVDARHEAQVAALSMASAAIPHDWRRGMVERTDLARFVFAPEDIVVAVGQDGLVANAAKHLDGQLVIGLNPDPERNPGVLVRHPPTAANALLAAATSAAARDSAARHTMVEAQTDDGQVLRALNEIYVGHPGHQSARYTITTPDGRSERQSSSGVLIGTGTGSTGWCRSAWLERHSAIELPSAPDPRLCWFVREAWPSPATGTACTEGLITQADQLILRAESDLVIFGDGIESDALGLSWGQEASIRIADRQLHLA